MTPPNTSVSVSRRPQPSAGSGRSIGPVVGGAVVEGAVDEDPSDLVTSGDCVAVTAPDVPEDESPSQAVRANAISTRAHVRFQANIP
jgi:hypothetical protein